MLRLFTSRSFHELFRNSPCAAACVTRRHQLPRCSAVCQHGASLCVRHLSTGRPVWKDASLPMGDKCEEKETIDLDKWKSVMRKAALEGKQQQQQQQQQIKEEEDVAAEEISEGRASSLEATRDLVTMWRHAGKVVPEEVTDEQLEILSELTTKSSRKKYLKFLAIKEGYKKSNKEKQQKRKVEREARLEERRAEAGDTTEPKNSLILQFWGRSLDNVLAWSSAQAMCFNQPLVFDLSYDSLMSQREMENTVSQLMEMEAWNRRAKEPFHLHFCNLQPGGAYEQALLKRYGAETWKRLFITCTQRQHVDLFPPERLVYLTPDSPNVLRTFDHSKVYIVGAMVDRSIKTGVSLANAKRLKLNTARLPLDNFLQWGVGGKNLTLDQMIRIMLTAKDTGKWEEALQFVPTRKHDGLYKEGMMHHRVRGATVRGQREERQGPLRMPLKSNTKQRKTYKSPLLWDE